jgi:hypothetical protein
MRKHQPSPPFLAKNFLVTLQKLLQIVFLLGKASGPRMEEFFSFFGHPVFLPGRAGTARLPAGDNIAFFLEAP